MDEYCGAVLGSDIWALPVQGRRIMYLPECMQQILVRYYIWVKFDLHRFRMPGFSGTDIPVGWILVVAPGVSDLCLYYALDSPEGRFNAPEASGSKSCFFRHQNLLLLSHIVKTGLQLFRSPLKFNVTKAVRKGS